MSPGSLLADPCPREAQAPGPGKGLLSLCPVCGLEEWQGWDMAHVELHLLRLQGLCDLHPLPCGVRAVHPCPGTTVPSMEGRPWPQAGGGRCLQGCSLGLQGCLSPAGDGPVRSLHQSWEHGRALVPLLAGDIHGPCCLGLGWEAASAFVWPQREEVE